MVKLRAKAKANGEESLYLDIYYKGRRSYEFLNLYLTKDRERNKEIRRLAEDVRAKRQLELSASNFQLTPHFKTKVNYIEYFESLAKQNNRSWRSTLIHLKGFAGEAVPFGQIDEKWLVEFQKYLTNTVSRNSAQTYFAKVKASLNYAKRDKLIQTNPCENIDNIKGEDVERTYLTLAEIRLLAETPSDRDEVKRAFLFACFTGLRLSDVKALRWKNVADDQIVLRIKKTGQPEYIPLSKSAIRFLPQRGLEESPVFSLMESEYNIWTALQRWADAAGIKKHVSFHVSRHTFATLSLTSGADLYTVSKLLGHTSIKNTQIYARIVDQKKRDAVNLLPEV